VRLYRFIVVKPWKVTVVYEPLETFVSRIRLLCRAFADAHDIWPTACYVSVNFPGTLPGPIFLGTEEPGEMVVLQFRRQALLAMDEVLLGVEVETDLWEGDDEQFERAIG